VVRELARLHSQGENVSAYRCEPAEISQEEIDAAAERQQARAEDDAPKT
jgi:hypothetical protein